MNRTTTLLALCGAGIFCMALQSFPAGSARGQSRARPVQPARVSGEEAAKVHCGTCHRVPPPDVLPRGAWRDEIARMFLIHAKQLEPAGPRGTLARLVALPAEWQPVVRHYEANAPELLAPLAPWPPPDRAVPAHATLDAADFDADGDMDLVVGNFSVGAAASVAATIFENRRVVR